MKIHLIGVGGIGMSALARILLAQGDEVSGSDASDGQILSKLRKLGGRVCVGHSTANLNHPDVVVYSSAVASHNPELIAARNRGIPVLSRGQMLARRVAGRRLIAVAGAHGKSTTAALIGQVLLQAGLDPTLVLGAEVDSLGGNARLGRGPYAVVESDESDGSFLWLRPWIAVLTNVDDEHLDYFRSRWEIEEAFTEFSERVLPQGSLVGCADDPWVADRLTRSQRRSISYGLSEKAQVRAVELRPGAGGSAYRCIRDGRDSGLITLQIPGRHNVVNSLAAVAVAELLQIPFPACRKALGGYRGARRRFQIHGESGGVLVVEDYGHHPAEVQVTLQAAKGWGRRIRCLFQPHRYSRTRYLLGRFASCFGQADEVILLPIYAASEEPLDGDGDGQGRLVQAIRRAGHRRVRGCSSAEEALDYLKATSSRGDLVLFLGAGSVGGLAGRFLRMLPAGGSSERRGARHAA